MCPAPPFRLDLTVWTLRRLPINRVDRWDGTVYRRAVAAEGVVFELAVRQEGAADEPTLDVEVWASTPHPALEGMASGALERLLGTNMNLARFYRFAATRREIRPLVERFRGVKPPRFLTLFEALVNGILFQQVSLAAGMTLMNHFVERYVLSVPGSEVHAFPLPESVAGLEPPELRPLGVSRQKARALSELGSAITGGLDLEQTGGMSDGEAVAFLETLRGVGRWTAQYCLLRGLGRLEVFPGDDVGARNKVKEWLGLDSAPDYEAMRSIALRWHPYSGMVYFHLLLNYLAEKGYLGEGT